MDLWRQLESVARNRWVGAYWQSKGLTVIPTVSWSTSRSFEFCFDGIEQGGTVAVGMIGCSQSKKVFLRGYNEMLERLTPEKIIVYGNPFKEIQGNLIRIEYQANRKKVR